MAARLLPAQTSDVRQRLVLLTGQAFFFGITLAMLIVSSTDKIDNCVGDEKMYNALI